MTWVRNPTTGGAMPAPPVVAPIESITETAGGWVCVCRNTEHSSGFYPCDESGAEIEPTIDGPWDGVSYVCAACGRIIDQNTLKVTGRAKE